MKFLKKYFLFWIFIVLVSIDYLGLYQLDMMQVNEIHIEKPFAYSYSSASSSDDNTILNLLKNKKGLKTKFELKDELLSLNFKNYLKNKNITLFFKMLNYSDLKFIQNSNEKCVALKLSQVDGIYSLNNVIYKNMIRIDLIANNEEDIEKFYKQICDE